MQIKIHPILGCMLIILCVFFCGCLDGNEDQNNIINLAEGSNLDIYGTVMNSGTSEQPDYQLNLIIKNNGINEVTYDGLFSSFLDVKFGQNGTSIHNISTPIDRKDFNSITISPSEAVFYNFSSGPTTGKEAKISNGALSYNLVLFKNVDNGVETILFAKANLPKVLGNETDPAELNPGEAQEIKFERPNF